jgi:uncharacterized protein
MGSKIVENGDRNYGIIGVLHLAEFPKYNNRKEIEDIKKKALEDLSALQFGGVDAVLIENEFEGHSSPYGEFLSLEQRKIMFEVVQFLKPYIIVPLGFCVLLNDYKTAFLLAKKFGGKFIRLDTFVDNVERISDGIRIIPDPLEIIKFKNKIGAREVEIWADVHVKHMKVLEKKSIEESAKEALQGGADRIIVTGDWTGEPAKIRDINKIKKTLPDASLVIGSGITKDNIAKYTDKVNDFIVGTAFKKNGRVDIEYVKVITSVLNGYIKNKKE